MTYNTYKCKFEDQNSIGLFKNISNGQIYRAWHSLYKIELRKKGEFFFEKSINYEEFKKNYKRINIKDN